MAIGAPVLVGSAGSDNTAGSTLVVTLDTAVAAGDVIIIGGASGQDTTIQDCSVSSVADSGGNTYTVQANPVRISRYYCSLITSPGGTALGIGATVTLTYATSCKDRTAEVFKVSGANIADLVDALTTASSNSSTPGAGPTATLEQAAELAMMFAGVGDDTTAVFTADTANGWTALPSRTSGGALDAGANNRFLCGQYKIVAATTAVTSTGTLLAARNWAAALVTLKEGAGGITGTVNQTAETDTAQTVAKLKAKALGQPSETDTPQAITAVKSRTIGQATETDQAQAFAVNPLRRLVNQTTETDQAQALTVAKTVAVGQASSTETAQPFIPLKTRTLGQASETGTAQAITPPGAQTIPVAQASETDSAQAVTSRKTITLGQAGETGAAQPLAPLKTRTIGPAGETDAAQGITVLKVKAIAQAAETDAPQAFLVLKTLTVGQAQEAATAQAFTALKALAIGQASETDSALAVERGGIITVAVGQVTETDAALPIAVVSYETDEGATYGEDSDAATYGAAATATYGEDSDSASYGGSDTATYQGY